jgi:flagellar L-ring protein precursor FlgH
MASVLYLLFPAILAVPWPAAARSKPAKDLSPLDRFIQAAGAAHSQAPVPSPGSTFQPAARLADLSRDLRAAQVHDIVTIIVSDRASAIARGSSSSKRSSAASASISSLFGVRPSPGPLSDLASLKGETQLQGEGETSRESTLSTSLTACVTHVLPNGNLVLEGVKDVTINSERQTISVRGIARPHDLTRANEIRSDHLAMLEIQVNGKGIVGDAIRRPFFLYRLLLGLLPF